MASTGSRDGSYDEKARIYALANPGLITSTAGPIQSAMFEALEVAAGQRDRLTFSESSAWFDYVAVGELWDRAEPPALPDREEAARVAESVLTRIEKNCSGANPDWPDVLRGIALLPPVGLLRRAGIAAIARPDGSAWDHWLYRAEPQLLLDGGAKRRAGVFGAQVEVRIGHLGRVIGIRSRWRPLSGERLLAEPVHFHPQEEGSGHGHSGDHEQPPIINFLLEGDGIPQHYLAPYYFQTNGHDLYMSGASAFSLTVDVGRTRQTDSAMTLTALAQGGSGDYSYNWATYSLVDPANGLEALGSGRTEVIQTSHGPASSSSLEVANGHYMVMLNVRDRSTGAFKHHQQQVFSSAFATAGGSDNQVA